MVWVSDPSNPTWWYDPALDVSQESAWIQLPAGGDFFTPPTVYEQPSAPIDTTGGFNPIGIGPGGIPPLEINLPTPAPPAPAPRGAVPTGWEEFINSIIASNIAAAAENARRFNQQLGAQQREAAGKLALGGRELDVRQQLGLGQLALGGRELDVRQQLGLGQLGLGREELAQRSQQADRSQRLALISALFAHQRGPMGPANRRMALELMRGLYGAEALGPAGAATPGPATAPNYIAPWMWDQLPGRAKELIIEAYEAQGGDPQEFLMGIEQQRPQEARGRTTFRFAAPVGA